MKLFGKCETPLCGRYAIFVRRRKYKTKAGLIRSQREVCSRCHRRTKTAIKSMA